MNPIDFGGLRFKFVRSNSPVAYCALTIRSGTRYEDQRFGGLAHFTEHLLFKGTEGKSGRCINSYIEKLGGELNAFTTKEELVLHTTVLKEDISRAIALLIELAFTPTFPIKEIEKEKTVVLDEIISYKDSPSEQIFDDFEEMLFEGTSLSMPVLGKTQTLKKIGVAELNQFVKSRFRPDNMAFTVVANLQEEKVIRLLERALKKYVQSTILPSFEGGKGVFYPPEPIATLPVFDKAIHRKGHQTHCIIGAQAYSFYDKRRIALILLVNVLGGPAANSRLNTILREKNALVYNVDATYTQYTDTGVVTIYFGCDKRYYPKCVKLVVDELERFRTVPMSDRELKRAKKQLLGQITISSDNGEAQCLSMGKSLLVFGEVIGTERTRELIEAVTSEEIQEVAKDIFSKDRICRLCYV